MQLVDMVVNEMRGHDLSVSYQKVGVSIDGEMRGDRQDGYLKWRRSTLEGKGPVINVTVQLCEFVLFVITLYCFGSCLNVLTVM